MSDKPKIIDVVKPDGPGLTPFEREAAARDRDAISAANMQIIQRLNRRGVQIDSGLEAVAQFRRFLVEVGVLTYDQCLAAEVIWEQSFHQQLKASLAQVKQMQAAANQPQLATPPQGLILPN